MFSAKVAARQMARVVARSGVADLNETLRSAVQKDARWIGKLCKAITVEFDGKRPSVARLARFIQSHPAFRPVTFSVEYQDAPEMRPADGRPREWRVPPITTVGELAAWLNLPVNELLWFADSRNLERLAARNVCHYKRHWVPKRDETFRLIESPKQRLKAIQRAILRDIIGRIPSHDACHGFKPNRSILTFARPHVRKAVVLKMDIKDFFPTFSFARAQNLFLTAGYPENVARPLAGLCTTICPREMFRDLPSAQQKAARALFLRKHLAQGSPTSPILANLCAFNLDCRFAGLAKAAGAAYTRYADDIVFSGGEDFARGVHRFLVHAMAVALEEGFTVHARKTRVMRQGVSQRAAGVVLNEKPNVRRVEFDLLKATLTNCARHGVASQNRTGHHNFRAHLEGRIAHVTMINPARGEKLRRIFEAIRWD
jgi:RNA-directed DNA polymerase